MTVQANERLRLKAKEAWNTTVLAEQDFSMLLILYSDSFIYISQLGIYQNYLVNKNHGQFKWQTHKLVIFF